MTPVCSAIRTMASDNADVKTNTLTLPHRGDSNTKIAHPLAHIDGTDDGIGGMCPVRGNAFLRPNCCISHLLDHCQAGLDLHDFLGRTEIFENLVETNDLVHLPNLSLKKFRFFVVNCKDFSFARSTNGSMHQWEPSGLRRDFANAPSDSFTSG